MATLELNRIGKVFGTTRVLSEIDLAVAHGEFVILVGPSGCGKSTLLRIIAGLETRHDGEVVIGKKNVTGLRAKERDIAMVFQSYALYPHMTVARNLGFSLRIKRLPKPAIAERVGRAAEILNLTPLLNRYPKELSGGQRQRVAMGRALVRDPAIFLFDEPLSNLDANLRVAMRQEISDLHARLGSTIVYVTHDQIEAMTMADKIVVMNAGRIEQVGRPLDLYDNPQSRFVARFIGAPAMNFLAGSMEGGAARIRLADGAGELSLAGRPARSGAVEIGVRPEHIRVGRDLPEAALQGIVRHVVTTGADSYLDLDLGSQRLTALTQERPDVGPGDRVAIAIPPSAPKLFDTETGARIEF
ncbi:MAG: sn-glycerol-3-phosphate ABC transporter ATP-binding protein UgpC [Paracoccaceae bacterium]|nr:sn-glycerol-3-phosphate ABC transporter ATP-binding protein UgpC [Paracoccaceae bacterium]